MMDVQDVIQIHHILIDKFGGSHGVRDLGALEAAIHRPFATFDKQELYPTVEEKAAAIFESILINHPFIDGNKRTAYVMLRLILMDHGFDIHADQDEKYNMVMSVIRGEMRFEGIKDWIVSRISKRKVL